jgi:hypothetical protein
MLPLIVVVFVILFPIPRAQNPEPRGGVRPCASSWNSPPEYRIFRVVRFPDRDVGAEFASGFPMPQRCCQRSSVPGGTVFSSGQPVDQCSTQVGRKGQPPPDSRGDGQGSSGNALQRFSSFPRSRIAEQ